MRREPRLELEDDADRRPAVRLPLAARRVSTLQAVSGAALNQIIHNRLRIATSDPEALHQIRVGLRHLDAVVRFFSTNIPERKRIFLARELKRFGRKLSRAREIDVFLDEVISRAPHSSRLGPDIVAIERLCRREQKREYAYVRRVLASRRFEAFLSTVRSCLVDEKNRLSSLRADSHRAVIARLADMKRKLREGRHVDVLNRNRLHRFRLRVKRMRYAVDFVAPLFDSRDARAARHMSGRLRCLQNELGAVTDRRAHAGLFKELRKCGSSGSGAGEIDWKRVKRFLFAGRRKAKAASLMRARAIYRKFAKVELR